MGLVSVLLATRGQTAIGGLVTPIEQGSPPGVDVPTRKRSPCAAGHAFVQNV
jgi:hypothetical protein